MAKIIEFPSDYDVEKHIKLVEEVKQKSFPEPVKNCLRIRIPEIIKMWKDIRPEFSVENISISNEGRKTIENAVKKIFNYIREKDWELAQYIIGMQVRICELEYELGKLNIKAPYFRA